MAILLLLINANFQSVGFIHAISSNIPVIGTLIFNGNYDDINRYWYPRVGLAFLILVISTVFSNILSTLFWEGVRVYYRKCKAKKQLLQADMNQYMLGGMFEIDAKYSLTLALIFLCCLYFGPLPLLLPLLCVYFTIQFWLDKLYITKFARRPPHFHADLHQAMTRMIPFALFFHCIFSMWAYGTPNIWPEGVEKRTDADGNTAYYAIDRSFNERLFNENSLPFFILLWVLVGLYIIELILEKYLMKYFFQIDSMIDLNQEPFTDIKDKMRGFSEVSYDPMLNPEYAKILTSMLDVAQVNKEVDLAVAEDEHKFLDRAKTQLAAKKNLEKQEKMKQKALNKLQKQEE